MILKLIKDELEYIQLINESTKKQNLYTTQLALILVEQVKFLISKEQYKLAFGNCENDIDITIRFRLLVLFSIVIYFS